MTALKERMRALVDKLTRDVVSTLIVRYSLRLKPETLQHFRELFEDALKAYAAAVELHGHDRPDDGDDLVERMEDTRPGWTRRPPPPKKP